jgi:hypothetical protein
MAIVFSNNARTTLASGISSSATSITVTDGSVFPSLTGNDIFYCTIDDGTNNEIVEVTAISGNTLTVVRAQDNTSANAFVTGDLVELRLVAKVLETFPQLNVGELTADEFIGDLRGAVIFKAQAGEAVSKGDAVYVSGISGNTPVIALADADFTSKMPAFGLVLTTASTNGSTEVVTFGTISGVDTSAFSVGDTLYVSTTAGELTNSKPTGEASLIQNIGKVQRSHASAGSIKVGGAGRTNDVPNLNEGNIFIGNASNQATTASLNTKIEDYLDGGTSTPSFATVSSGAITSSGAIISTNSGNRFDALSIGDDSDIYLYEGSTNVLNIRTGASGSYKYFTFQDDGYFNTNSGGISTGGTARITSTGDLTNIGTISTGDSSHITASNGSFSIGKGQSNYVEFLSSTGSGQPKIRPSDSGTVDIGDLARKFKSLYLSGTISSGTITASDTSGSYGTAMNLTAGDTLSAGQGAKQIVMAFGSSSTVDYPHSIRTRHNSSAATGNTVEFWLWHQGTDSSSTVGTQRALVLESSTGLDLLTGGYKVGGQEVISSSRNLTNIGTISSGAITSTGTVTATGGNSTNWNTAYGWGNHASQGYITNSTASLDANKITSGVLNAARIPSPVNGDWWNGGVVKVGTDGVMEVGKYLDFHTADSGGNADYDLRVTASAGALTVGGTISATGGSSTNWNTAYGWGNHASQSYATESYVGTQISNLVDSSPAALNTLNELAAALGDDANFSTTVTNSIATKAPLASPSFTTKITTPQIHHTSTISVLNGSSAQGMKVASLYVGTSYSNSAAAGQVNTLNGYRVGGVEVINSSGNWIGGGNISEFTNNSGYITGNQTITLSGDVSGSGTTSIAVTVADDSHNHIISNVDGLQTALDAKLASSSYTAADVLTKIKTVDGSGSGLDADTVDGQHASAFLTGNQTITLSGDVSGSGTTSISVTVADDSHNHVISNVDGLATAFDNSYITSQNAVNLAVGWYTIATNTGDRASARFGIWDINSSDHQSVTFYAAHHFGTDASNTLTVLDNSYFAGNPFRYIRIKDGGTYDGAALQIYIDDATNNVNAAILGDNFQSSGWVLKDWVADATDPGDLSNYGSFGERSKVDLDNIAQGGFATTGEIYAGGDTTQYRAFHDAYHPNADAWTTSRTITLGGDLTGNVSINGSANVTLTAAVVDDSHNHVISNVDGLQTALDGKLSTSGTAANSQLLDSLDSTQFLRSDTFDTSSSGLYLQGGSYNAGTDTATAPLIIDLGDHVYTKDGTYLRKLIGKTTGNTIEVGQGGTALIGQINLLPGTAGNSAVKINGGTVWNVGNDGSGSGLDADLLDGLQSDFAPTVNTIPIRNANGDISAREIVLSSGLSAQTPTVLVSMYPSTNQLVRTTPAAVAAGMGAWTSSNDGSGSGLDADLLDGQQGSYYAPANHGHSYLPLSGGTVTGATSLRAGGTHLGNHEFASASGTSTGYSDAGIEIREGAYGGSAAYSAPRLSFHWGNVVASNISIDTGGAILIRNNPGTAYENFRANNIYANGTNLVWHTGNDGSGSGLDADTLDGLNLHNTQGTQNTANTVLRTQDNGYTMLGWINTTSGVASGTPTRIYCSQDSYIRYYTPASLAPYILNQGSTKNAHVHSEYLGTTDTAANSQLLDSIDSTGFMRAGRTLTTINTISNGGDRYDPSTNNPTNEHYAVLTYGNVGNVTGQLATHFVSGNLYSRGYNSSWSNWRTYWNSLNDGSGSGLDADTVDSLQASQLVSGGTARKSSQVSSFAGVNEVSGFYFGQNITGAPTTDWINYMHSAGNSWSSSNNYSFQLTHAFHSDNLWVSRTTNGSQSTVRKVWDSASDGSGSGLDADFLDGYNAEEGAVNNSIVKRDGNAMITAKKLYLNGGNYEGQIIFGAVDSWRTGIRQHDDGDAEMRIWAKNAAGRVHIATGYDGQPTSISRPTDGFVVNANNVGIGNFSGDDPSQKLHVKGNILATGNVTAYSDEKLKDDIQVIGNAVEKVKQLRGVTFIRNDIEDNKRQTGIIAQEVEKVLPEVVGYDEDRDTKTVAYGNMVGLLIEAIKEQQETINKLTSRLDDIEKGE